MNYNACFFKKYLYIGGEIMAEFFINNPEVRAEFENLSIAVKNAIIESGIEIKTVEQLKRTARNIVDNM